MKRVLINGIAVAVIAAAPLAGHFVLTTIGTGTTGTVLASTDLPSDYLATGTETRQVTPRAPTTVAPAAATATPVAAGAQATKGKAAGQTPAQTGKAAPAQTGKAGAEAPKAGAAPAQTGTGKAAPAQTSSGGTSAGGGGAWAGGAVPSALPRTGEVPLGALALVGTAVLGAGIGLRRFRR